MDKWKYGTKMLKVAKKVIPTLLKSLSVQVAMLHLIKYRKHNVFIP